MLFRSVHVDSARVLDSIGDGVFGDLVKNDTEGFTVTLVRPSADGRVSPDALDAVLADDVALVSIMSANNETGVVQPLAELAAASHEAGALMHTDAAQAFGKIPLALEDVDGVSLSAHKIGGPVGVGALVLRSRCPFRPREFGGGQEGGRRPGTQDVREGGCLFVSAWIYEV